MEKPDAIFLITDPRYFTWLFNIENEIRKKMPIIYLNIWDSPFPYPLWNKVFYESCDVLLSISKQTKNINEVVLGDKAKNKIIKYIPHGLNEETYFPITPEYTKYKEYKDFKKQILGDKEYSFVYLDKYFKHLKKLFVFPVPSEDSKHGPELISEFEIANSPEINAEKNWEIPSIVESTDDEAVIHYLKNQEFTYDQFCDLAVSFLQSEMLLTAQTSSEMALKMSGNNVEFLRASYLKLTSLLMQGDYRSVIDVGHESLKRANSKDDILSFLYGQAEAYMRLRMNDEAREVLKKIIDIDETYRLAKMRLEKLNEL
jgi:tetratricopeptide (TPR) repeat protein